MRIYTLLVASYVFVSMFGCSERQAQIDQASAVAENGSQLEAKPDLTMQDLTMQHLTMQKWLSSCALCHVSGEAGAPRVGNLEEWGPRIAQGSEVLLQHTIEGFNNMPPLGYCMSCEREDFQAMIIFMAGNQ
ncbi:MAG: cytochrome c5 family protein [Gammaproteobacteria bacterium]|nr:cytochrome c5 family protein [Gammaproteobacteria bacterium]